MSAAFSVNSKYNAVDFKKMFSESFNSEDLRPLDKDGVKVIHEPFTCAVLPNFLNSSFLDDLEVEAHKFPLHRRQNDLFSFNQSDDLLTLFQNAVTAKEFPLLLKLRKFFGTDMLKWMKDVTGTNLDEDVNSTISLYNPHDYLLCHDDELERRRIAFIIYLVPENWDCSTEGGALDLFDSGPFPDSKPCPNSGDYHPWRVVRSLPPIRNCLAFFEVCSKSFHQVSEVVGNRGRLSIHGWYMSDPLPRVRRSPDPLCVPRLPPCFIEEDLFFKWINPIYIDTDQQMAILRRFRSASEIRLPQFFIESQWKKLCCALAYTKDSTWLKKGPMDLRNISVLPYKNADNDDDGKDLPEECREVRRLLSSEAMLVILSQMTGVTLHPLLGLDQEPTEETDKPGGSSQSKRPRLEAAEDTSTSGEVAELTPPRFHRWRAGMYTLLADADSGVVAVPSAEEEVVWRLDLFYHIAGWSRSPLLEAPASAAETSEGGQLLAVAKKTVDKSLDKTGSGDASDRDVWQPSWNGQIIYVARDDNSELLRISPENNALTLVYSDSGSAKFVRYLNAKARPFPVLPGVEHGTYAYDVSLSYFDPSPNDGLGDDGLSVATCEETEEEEEYANSDGDAVMEASTSA